MTATVLLCACSTAPASLALDLAAASDMGAFDFADAAVWRHGADEHGGWLELFGVSTYVPPHRSPQAFALLRGHEFGDFDLTLRAQQTTDEYPHRDLVIVFGWCDPAHFAYAHFASIGDENAHQIMLVDGADRRPVTTTRTRGVQWGDSWHELRVVRRGEQVEAFFDGTSVLAGRVPAWRGRIGFGSFDDTGRFAALRIVAP